MKGNRIHASKRRLFVPLAVTVLALAALGGVIVFFGKMRAILLEQAVVREAESQVFIEPGKMVGKSVIAHCLGLTNGANLATIDFDERREDLLRRIPNLRDVRIRRQLPDKVFVTVEERKPIARLNIKGRRADSGRVADAQGVVFEFVRGTRLLPVIREKTPPGTAKGQKLTGRALAALRLVEACRESSLQEVAPLDIDISHADWLLATLNTGRNYVQLKIAWEGMDEDETPASRASLIRQLTHVRDAMRSEVGANAVIWNATDFSTPGRIYADTKGNL